MDASHYQPWLGTGTENLMMVGFPVHGGHKRFMARRGQALIIWLVAKSAACHPVSCLNTQYDNGWEPDVWLWGRLGGRWGEGWLCVLFFSQISPSAASCSWFATVPVGQTQCFCQITRLAAFGRPNRQLSPPKANFCLIQFLSLHRVQPPSMKQNRLTNRTA